MPSRTVVVGSRSGLHARPAAIFVAAAGSQPVPVRISVEGKPAVPAASILSVLALGAKQGTEVRLEADGDGADAALDHLAELLSRDLDGEDSTPDTPDTPAPAPAASPAAAGETADG